MNWRPKDVEKGLQDTRNYSRAEMARSDWKVARFATGVAWEGFQL